MVQVLLPEEMASSIEAELKKTVKSIHDQESEGLEEMLAYHMGWIEEGYGPDAGGKRLRPFFLLLTSAACGGEWKHALPAAASVELLHNFSLIHDDIQDQSDLRRGRPTVWKKWGAAQAITAGDTMFTLAQSSLLNLHQYFASDVVIHALRVLQIASIQLTKGQFLDISYEDLNELSLDAYWPMISGKTAALLAACTQIGALTALVDETIQSKYKRFGYLLGLAFQVRDDFLGIWGDETLTGKSNESDLLSRKKSLPVLFALEKNAEFADYWRKRTFSSQDVPHLTKLLESEGAYQYTTQMVEELTQEALGILDEVQPQGSAGVALKKLANMLLNREG